jgi:hypothetical protein
MADTKATATLLYKTPGTTPFTVSAPGVGVTTVLLWLSNDVDPTTGKPIYYTAAFFEGSVPTTTVALSKPTNWAVLVTLPAGRTSTLAEIEGIFPIPPNTPIAPSAAGVKPADDPPPPPPGTVKGGDHQ